MRKVLGIHAKVLCRLAVGAVSTIVVAGLAAPYVNAGAFRSPIQESLEEALGRKVDIETVHFNLFTGPGFILQNVTIKEDPRYGSEPFAYVPQLEVRVRLDKLILGRIRPLGLRLRDASLNLVKSEDGSWNAVALVERLGAPRRAPFNFLPAVQIQNGRVDFKLGTRKTTLYLTDTDLSIYPEHSGKIYFKFEGSPARTDRAGNGFGHLAGTANWYLQPAAETGNQLEADVNLQPSNLSELTTLFQGQDLGVHGTLSGHIKISGPLAGLRVLGDIKLEDVHRWDLLPSPGDSWPVRFRADVDLPAHTLDLATLEPSSGVTPVSLRFRARDFMTHPAWSVLATLHKAPLASVLPLGKRMGMGLPPGLEMDGTIDGVLGISNSAGLEGGVVITNAVANVPDVPPLRSASANITISADKVHIDPAILQSDAGGTLRAGGDFDLSNQELTADISADQFSVNAFRETTDTWFGSPKALSLIQEGSLSGHFLVSYSAGAPQPKPVWAGQLQLANAIVNIPGVKIPVTRLQGKATFDQQNFEMPHLSGFIGNTIFSGSYRYNSSAKRPEHLRLDFPVADLGELESALVPTLSDDSLLSRLPFRRRTIPGWLASRNMEGDLAVTRFSVRGIPTGPMSAHLSWLGTDVEISGLEMDLPSGHLGGSGLVGLSRRLPQYHFATKVNGYAWGGGILAADGAFESSGTGPMVLQNLKAEGAFSGEGIAFTGADAFTALSGHFAFAFDGDSPLLKLTKVEARQNNEEWSGDGASNPDGKLHLDLTNGERQLHLVEDFTPPEREAKGIAAPLR